MLGGECIRRCICMHFSQDILVSDAQLGVCRAQAQLLRMHPVPCRENTV